MAGMRQAPPGTMLIERLKREKRVADPYSRRPCGLLPLDHVPKPLPTQILPPGARIHESIQGDLYRKICER